MSEPAFQGPLPVRNQHPAQLTVLHLPPAAASVQPAGAVQVHADAAYSSLWLLGQSASPASSWRMDGELLRVAASLRAGLGAGLEFGIELPAAHTSGGFLDAFLIDYHKTLGLPDQSRDTNPRNEFDVEARRDGNVVWSMERDSFEWLDVPLWLTCQLREPGDGRLGLAVRGGLELPTGDDARGYGSGTVEPGLGMLGELPVAGVDLTAHAQHTWAGTPAPAKRGGLEFADVTSLGLGLELPLATDLHALVQVEWETSTLRRLGVRSAGREQFLLWFGARYELAAGLGVEVGFGEDLHGLVSPDFTAWLGMVWNPGAGRTARGPATPPPSYP